MRSLATSVVTCVFALLDSSASASQPAFELYLIEFGLPNSF